MDLHHCWVCARGSKKLTTVRLDSISRGGQVGNRPSYDIRLIVTLIKNVDMLRILSYDLDRSLVTPQDAGSTPMFG